MEIKNITVNLSEQKTLKNNTRIYFMTKYCY